MKRATSRAPPIPSTADEPRARDCHSGARVSANPQISRFRVWSFGPSRNDNHKINKVCPTMPVTLDPDAAAVFKAFKEAGRPAYETLTPAEARAFYLAARVVSNPEPAELESVRPLSIPAPHGSIPARLYTPKRLRKTGGLAPCLVFFHGGGWVIGDLDSHDVVCRKLADHGELIVISVDYRLAPEHKFPAAVEDAITATEWVASNAGQLGVDASRLTVGGDSAGGNLAAVVAISARDGNGPAIAGQVLIYPATDLALTHR